MLDPSIPFEVHPTAARRCCCGPADAAVAGFRPADADLAGWVVRRLRGLDAWYEEDERIVSHPRDPFHRIDVLASSRHVRLELDGHLLAESTRPRLLFETLLPVRFYLPAEDVRVRAAAERHPDVVRVQG